MSEELLRERVHLAETKETIAGQLAVQREEAKRQEENIFSAAASMQEESSQSFAPNLWRADDFEQLVELSQFSALVTQNDSSYELMCQSIRRLEAQEKAPYFARIDFLFAGESAPRELYIGRFSLMEGHRMLVYDWRSPLAGVFYQYGLGKASYRAAVGEITGEVRLKRQYEIENGELRFFFDTEVEILDEHLKKLLGQNASPQMKSIVETIQRDQDAVIRDQESDLLIVQGAAGSGKTSIALHRVAYLMYRGLAGRLSSQSIVILSPHALFERYIAGVLPELGEESVASYVLEELLETLLKCSRLQTRHQLLETLFTNASPWTQTMKESLAFKTSSVFLGILDTLTPTGPKFQQVLSAYRALFETPGELHRLAEGLALPESLDEILRFTQENLQSKTLFFDDASALAYLTVKAMGRSPFAQIRQVVIDEAQDYAPLHFAILVRLFPNARFTLLGDIHQTIAKQETPAFYEEVQRVFGKRNSVLLTLDKSFRCASEITRFSAGLLGISVQGFGRSSGEPELIQVTRENGPQLLAAEIAQCQEQGHASIGILCKSAKEAKALQGRLSPLVRAQLMESTSGEPIRGVSILPIYLSKGLEFDAALLWNAGEENYHTEDDRRLLYIGCTRALHRLRLFYETRMHPGFLPAPGHGQRS